MAAQDHSAIVRRFAASFEQRLKQTAQEASARVTETEPAAVMPPTAPTVPIPHILPDATLESLMSWAEEQAALSGWFKPTELDLPGADERTRLAILTRLAAVCIVGKFKGSDIAAGTKPTDLDLEMYWTMLNERRGEVLARLNKEGLAAKLAEPLPPTDAYGQHLRNILRDGKSTDVNEKMLKDLLPYDSAIETVAELDLPHPDRNHLRVQIGRRSMLDDYEGLLGHGFFGRSGTIRQLRKFLKQPIRTDRPGSGEEWDGLVLSGAGGAGKSTVLAKFLRDIAEQNVAVAAVLDFDRPGIDPADIAWLEFEITRQVGYQIPQLDPPLRQARKAARDWLNSAPASLPSDERATRDILSTMRDLLVSNGFRTKPIVLVLDTFEQVIERRLTDKVLEWLNEVALALEGLALKVIISGRLYEQANEQLSPRMGRPIVIDELTPKASEQLLERLKVRPETARRLANSRVLPLRPLELRLMAREIGQGSPADVDNLEEAMRSGGKAAKDLFGAIIYRRVLLRIKDETARALAHPGLVLRFVTTELIRKVLAPILGLPPLSEQAAQQALDALAQYDWLVHREPDGSVWHRRDLRRSVLRVMTAQEAQRAKRIHEDASKFFESSSDPKLQAESIYNRLMLVDGPEDGATLEIAAIRAAAPFIIADAADFPRAGAALFAFAQEGQVPDSDIWLLPAAQARDAFSEAGRRFARAREYGSAARLLLRRIPHDNESRTPEDWEVETLFATVNWVDLAKLTRGQRQDDSKNIFAALTAPHTIPTMLFPYAVVGSIPSNSWLSALSAIAGLVASPVGTLTRLFNQFSFAQQFFRRVAMSLLLIDADLLRDPRNVEMLRDFVRLSRSKSDGMLPDQRMLFLAAMLQMGGEFKIPFTLEMIRLDKQWLTQPVPHPSIVGAGGDFKALLPISVEMLESVGGTNTTRRLLSRVDKVGRKIGRDFSFTLSLPLIQPESFLDQFRGPDPEFRDPVRYALLDAFSDRRSHGELADIIRAHLSLELQDLSPARFTQSLYDDTEHGLQNYVELIDRAWMLGPVIEAAHKARPTSGKLSRVAEAYARWDSAVRKAVGAVAP